MFFDNNYFVYYAWVISTVLGLLRYLEGIFVHSLYSGFKKVFTTASYIFEDSDDMDAKQCGNCEVDNAAT